jgi:endonuclease YncB( thermonuclease family)
MTGWAVGKILPFRRRRRWTRSRDYGAPPPKTRFWPEDDKITLWGVGRETAEWLGNLRPFILGGILISIWPAADPALMEPPSFLSSDAERVNEQFTRCGLGRGHACVIDGDTFKLGERKVRIVGIDAPETHPARCAEEARLGEAATVELQRLLNQGAFEMTGRSFNDKDRYGRDLRVIRRIKSDGTEQSIAEDMRESGLARRYLGGFKGGWC